MIIQFQIDDKQKGVEQGTSFKVYCPGQYKTFPHKLMMYNNGSVSNNVKYQNLCEERFVISVAYNSEPNGFEIENNSMVDLSKKYGYSIVDWIGTVSYIPDDDEILSKFFLNHNILVNWIDCNYTWGWFDYETGKWTGAVGQVNIYSGCMCINIDS